MPDVLSGAEWIALLVFGLINTIIAVMLITAVLRRLIGARTGAIRTAVVALALGFAFPPAAAIFLPEGEPATGAGAAVAFGATLVFTIVTGLVVLTILEILVPTGSVPSPVAFVRGWRGQIARTRRYLAVGWIFARHGLGRLTRPGGGLGGRETARALARALEEAGPTYVKLGQFLSTRPDVLPAEFIDELSSLQSNVSPLPWEDLEPVLRAELGDDLSTVFEHIDPKPLASAALAQVHQARLRDGRDVAVKVQRPGIRPVVLTDLDIIGRLARRVQEQTDWGADLGAEALAAGFAASIREEMDFTIERDNMLALAGTLPPGTTAVRLPLPRGRTTPRLIIMDFVSGTTIGKASTALAALEPNRRHTLGAALVRVMLHQILVAGTFHTDLHPGNLVLDDAGGLTMLDCGSVGRIDSYTREALGLLLSAIDRGDALRACDALLGITDAPPRLDEPALRRDLGRAIVRYTAPGATLGANAFSEVFRIVAAHRLTIPPEVAAVFRSLATLDGTVRAVDPDADLLVAARKFRDERQAALADPSSWPTLLQEELVDALPLLRALPRRIARIAEALETGTLQVETRRSYGEAAIRRQTAVIQMAFISILGVTAFATGIWLITSPGDTTLWGVRAVVLAGGALIAAGITLLTRVLYTAITLDRRR
ncbi:MAG: AarF/UbiB family protein [Dehalococcoidia bacterium]